MAASYDDDNLAEFFAGGQPLLARFGERKLDVDDGLEDEHAAVDPASGPPCRFGVSV